MKDKELATKQIGEKVEIRKDLSINLQCYSGVVDGMIGYAGKEAMITKIGAHNSYDLDIDNGEYCWNDEMLEDYKNVAKGNNLFFAKLREDAIIPTKKDEDAGYDIYANFEEDYMVINPHETVMIPTGICSAFSSDYVAILKERGSTGTKGIAQKSGVIDSGFRGEWFVPITNTNNHITIISKATEEELKNSHPLLKILLKDSIIYPYTKAISQMIILPVPKINIQEISAEKLQAIPSKRGEGMLGSSGK